jgi:hypothetical protein
MTKLLTEHKLWPVGDSLHQRIDGDETERRGAKQDAVPIQINEYGEACTELYAEENERLSMGHGAGSDRS